MWIRKIGLTVCFFLFQVCKAPEYDAPCNFEKSSFQRIYFLKLLTNDKSSLCGLGTSSVNNSNTTNVSQSPSISYTGAPFTFFALSPITSTLPTVIGTFNSFSISPSLPISLAFNPGTGEISGTPNFIISSGSYTVTATSSARAVNTNFTLDIILPGKRIFLTAGTTPGSWGSIAGGDNICNSDVGKPIGIGVYKAMVGSSGRKACNNSGGCVGFTVEAIDWVLFTGLKFYRPDGTFIAQATSDRIFTFPLANSISTISTNVWTGIDSGWNTTSSATSECTGWTNAGFGNYGTSNATTNSILNVSNAACGTSYSLYCIEQ